MAKYKATVSFSGIKLSMAGGEVRELSDQALIDGLLKAGYIIEIVETHKKDFQAKEPEPQKETKPKTRGKGKKS